MFDTDNETVAALLGSGGVAGIVTALVAWSRDRRKNKKLQADTALERLAADYKRKQSEITELKTEIERLRRERSIIYMQYSRLWKTYVVGPPPGKKTFPFTVEEMLKRDMNDENKPTDDD